MFSNLTISKRLAAGFGSLVVLTVTLGAVSVFQMRSAATRAQKLSDQYVPEARVAADVKEATGRLSLAGRSFGLSGEEKYRDETLQHAKTVQEALNSAGKLAEKYPSLVKLAQDHGKAEQAFKTYMDLFSETVKANTVRDEAAAKLDQSAAQALKALDTVTSSQRSKLAGEVREGTSKEQLLRRVDMADRADQLTDVFSGIRVNAFKLQAARDLSLLAKIDQDFTSAFSLVDTLRSQFKDPKDLAELDSFMSAARGYQSAVADVGSATKGLNEIAPRRAQSYETLIKIVADINEAALVNAAALSDESSTALKLGEKVMIGGVSASVVIGLVLAFFTSRSINNALKKLSVVLATNSSQVASASTQVSSSSQSLAQGASEQAASLEESSSALNEMASMIKKNADTSAQAASFSVETKASTDRGTEAMSRMNTAIVDIERASSETAKIIKTIDEIAFQTNLLALNAAVEAARAGEAGKGFAVVAEEVRNLAMRSAEAAKNTSSLIEESVGKAKNGVSIAQQVAENLQQINDSVAKVTGLIAEIAASSKEQATGIEQITEAVGQMDKVTQTNAANAEETAAASEELNAQAEQLQGCVRELQMLVGLAAEASTPATTRQPPVRHSPRRAVDAPPSVRNLEEMPQAKSNRELIPLESAQQEQGDFSEFSKAA